jgi:hypothetical protein
MGYGSSPRKMHTHVHDISQCLVIHPTLKAVHDHPRNLQSPNVKPVPGRTLSSYLSSWHFWPGLSIDLESPFTIHDHIYS